MHKIELLTIGLFVSLVLNPTGVWTHVLNIKALSCSGLTAASQIDPDTCVIEGMTFDIINNGEINGLKATIKNGKLKIISNIPGKSDYRVIRYVFSIRRDEMFSSVRHYGDLVSYLVINLLKDAEKGDQFYFEDIIIVDPTKEIFEDAVKPIIIKKL